MLNVNFPTKYQRYCK